MITGIVFLNNECNVINTFDLKSTQVDDDEIVAEIIATRESYLCNSHHAVIMDLETWKTATDLKALEILLVVGDTKPKDWNPNISFTTYADAVHQVSNYHNRLQAPKKIAVIGDAKLIDSLGILFDEYYEWVISLRTEKSMGFVKTTFEGVSGVDVKNGDWDDGALGRCLSVYTFDRKYPKDKTYSNVGDRNTEVITATQMLIGLTNKKFKTTFSKELEEFENKYGFFVDNCCKDNIVNVGFEVDNLSLFVEGFKATLRNVLPFNEMLIMMFPRRDLPFEKHRAYFMDGIREHLNNHYSSAQVEHMGIDLELIEKLWLFKKLRN